MNTWLRRTILAAALIAGLVPVMAQVPPPVPGLPDTERRTSYSLTASNCACSVGFALYGDSTDFSSWIEVFVNGVQVTYNDPVFGWTVTSPTGPLATIARPITDGVLTFNSVQTGTVQIVGARRPRRTAQFNENTGVPARNINQVVTDIVAMLREVWDKINDVTGRVVRAPPGETMTMLPPAASRASKNACFDSSGNLIPCIVTSSGSIAAGNGIGVTGSNPAVISANIAGTGPIVVTPGATDTISCPSCSTFTPPTSTTAVVSSRAAAIGLNLSAFSAITTQGYANPGDGGGATFVKASASGGFLDSTVLTGSISNAGASCTNGTYLGVTVHGGHGAADSLVFNIVVSGNILSSVSYIWLPAGNGFVAGDVLTFDFGCPNAAWTVGTVSTPLASFTDTAGNKWQYVVDQGNYPNTRQFGAKIDGSTNDQASIQAALWYADVISGSIGTRNGYAGGTLIQPKGASLVCGGLVVPQGTAFRGVSRVGSALQECNGEASTTSFITLGDPGNQQTSFFPSIENMTLFAGSGTITGTVAMVYSNNAQGYGVRDVTIYPNSRACVFTSNGYGGVSFFGVHSLECVPAVGLTPFGISLNGAAVNRIDGDTFFSSGGIWAGPAILQTTNGPGIINEIYDVHIENAATGISLNIPGGGSGTITHIKGVNGGPGMTNVITRTAGSASNQIKVEASQANGATCLVNNSGSCVAATTVISDTLY